MRCKTKEKADRQGPSRDVLQDRPFAQSVVEHALEASEISNADTVPCAA